MSKRLTAEVLSSENEELKEAFRVRCFNEGRNMSEVIWDLIRDYLNKEGKL